MPTPAYPLERLSRVLISAASVAEIRALAPPVISEMLGEGIRCRIALGDEPARIATPGEDEIQAVVPLRTDAGSELGTLVIARIDGRAPELPTLNDKLLSAITGLLALAIVSRSRSDREHSALVEEATTLKIDAVSMLSHEMRTPLATIKGYATALMLEDTAWDEATTLEFLQIIDQESDRLSRLIQEILESASFEADAMDIHPEPILVQHIARRVVDRIGIQSSIHQFNVVFAPDFPVIEADADRVEQVLTNLVDNAVKYSPDGGLTVVRGEVLPGSVLVTVTDEGTGISPEDMKKLFDRFFRASLGRRRVSGAGLGLPISHAIVRAHGGRIWAESELGRGTTLSFTLPVTQARR